MKLFNRIGTALYGAVAIFTIGYILVSAQGAPKPAIRQGGGLDRRLVNYAQAVLTNAQVLALSTTPVTIVPAQGAGTVIEPIGGILSFNGNVAYTNVSGHNLKLYFGGRTVGNAASPTITMLGFLDQSAATILNFQGMPVDEIMATNTAIVLENVDGVAYTGGGAADTLTIRLDYRVHDK